MTKREDSRADTRARIVEAAADLVAKRGFGSASVRDIAEQAGFSQGAVYSNFESKEQMLLEVMRGHMTAQEEEVAALVAGWTGDADAFLAALERWANAKGERLTWAMLALELKLHARRDPTFGEPYDALMDAHADTMGRLITGLFTSMGRPAPPNAPRLARALDALVPGVALAEPTDAAAPGAMLVRVLDALVRSVPPQT